MFCVSKKCLKEIKICVIIDSYYNNRLSYSLNPLSLKYISCPKIRISNVLGFTVLKINNKSVLLGRRFEFH